MIKKDWDAEIICAGIIAFCFAYYIIYLLFFKSYFLGILHPIAWSEQDEKGNTCYSVEMFNLYTEEKETITVDNADKYIDMFMTDYYKKYRQGMFGKEEIEKIRFDKKILTLQ